MSILIFLFTLSVLVFVHELGHFLAAKKSGVKVEEFGFGIPPRIFGKKIGETIYSINLLPIGGFVRLKGEEGEVLGFGQKDSFRSISNFKRLFIVLSGVLGNLLLAYFIFTFLFLVGYPKFSGQIKVTEVVSASPAELSGLKVGDVFVNVGRLKVETPDDFVNEVTRQKGQKVDFGILREGRKLEISLKPRINPPEGQGPLGVRLGFEASLNYQKVSLIEAPVKAFEEISSNIVLMLSGLKKIFLNLFSLKVPSEVAGVVGIYKLSSQASEAGFRIFLQFVAIISLNLFMFNLLPIPALDGGRLLFILIEAVSRKSLNPKFEKWVNNIGLALLLTLFVLITIRDFRRL